MQKTFQELLQRWRKSKGSAPSFWTWKLKIAWSVGNDQFPYLHPKKKLHHFAAKAFNKKSLPIYNFLINQKV